ncbi:MAG: hypothetical protein H6510_04735 [Acidobacteria bacterium]|nr:hypothetical protein [Acidobacteriota bacterium]MCB9397103.1 hypothetical protein [Acidobacteriota bacterium]
MIFPFLFRSLRISFSLLLVPVLWAGTENYTGVWMDPGGQFGVIVGTGGSILHYDGSMWTIVSSPTSLDLYDVHGMAPDDVVASGNGVILHWDGMIWSIVHNVANTPFTPVFLTATRIWYGIPDSQFPIIGRCDRMGQGCLGLVAETGSVLRLQEDSLGNIVYIGVLGDIYQIDDSLTQTPIYDHPVGQTMEFTAATCVGLTTEGASFTAYGSNFLGIFQWQSGSWQFLDDPSGSVFSLKESSGEFAVEGVGLADSNQGFLVQVNGSGMVQTELVPGAMGIGIADLASSQTGIVAKRGEPCTAVEERIDTLAGDEAFIFNKSLCKILFHQWLAACLDGGTGLQIDMLMFVSSFNVCYNLN